MVWLLLPFPAPGVEVASIIAGRESRAAARQPARGVFFLVSQPPEVDNWYILDRHWDRLGRGGERVSLLRKLWKGWQRFGLWVGDVLARVILTLFYFTLFLPFGLFVRLFRDLIGVGERTPTWISRECPPSSVEEARKLS